uniref:Uncharacterized protein n=1 Tax=Cacopsylla melanoneura TaxID=428564 RepID=A0A8D8TD29_9HEMI
MQDAKCTSSCIFYPFCILAKIFNYIACLQGHLCSCPGLPDQLRQLGLLRHHHYHASCQRSPNLSWPSWQPHYHCWPHSPLYFFVVCVVLFGKLVIWCFFLSHILYIITNLCLRYNYQFLTTYFSPSFC